MEFLKSLRARWSGAASSDPSGGEAWPAGRWREALAGHPLFDGIQEALLVQEWGTDPLTRPIIAVNQGACRLLGREREALVGLGLGSLLHESDEALHRDLESVLLAGSPYAFSLSLRAEDGGELPVALRGGVLRLEGGGRAFYHLFWRRLAGAGAMGRQRQLQTAYRVAFNHLPAGVFVASFEGKLIRFNQALAELLGMETIRDLWARSRGDLREIMAEPLWVHAGGREGNGEAGEAPRPVKMRCHDGGWRPMLLRLRLLPGKGSRPPLWLGLVEEPSQAAAATEAAAPRPVRRRE